MWYSYLWYLLGSNQHGSFSLWLVLLYNLIVYRNWHASVYYTMMLLILLKKLILMKLAMMIMMTIRVFRSPQLNLSFTLRNIAGLYGSNKVNWYWLSQDLRRQRCLLAWGCCKKQEACLVRFFKRKDALGMVFSLKSTLSYEKMTDTKAGVVQFHVTR